MTLVCYTSFHTFLYEKFSFEIRLAVQTVPHSLSRDFLASEIMRSLVSADRIAETKGLCNNLVLRCAVILFPFLSISIYPNHYTTVQFPVNGSTGPNSMDRDHLNSFRKSFPGTPLKPTQTPESWEPNFFPAYSEEVATTKDSHV